MLTRKILNSGKRYISTCSSMPRRNIKSVDDVEMDIPKFESAESLPEQNMKLEQRPPFLKNMFIGKYDTELLAFPEPQSDERYKAFFEWIKPLENYMSSITSTEGNQVSRGEIFSKMKELNILRAKIDKRYGGLDMSEVEILTILETLASKPWLATSFIKNNLKVIDIISKYGNEEQKSKYLSKIGNGDLLPTICITEVSSGPNAKNIETTAKMSECGKFWTLNGKKIFVTNGEDSNLFIVVARCTEEKNVMTYDSLCTFIVESSHGGITFKDVTNTVGQEEVHICTVEFKDTRVPAENILGESLEGVNVLLNVFAPGNSRVAGEAIGILRKFMSLLNKNILGRKYMDQNMHEINGVQGIVADITCSLYSMESVAYFTSALNDTYENQDLELEKAVTEFYCANECAQQIYKGLQLLGAESYLKDNPYLDLYKDALGLSIYDGSAIDTQIYIGLLGLQYTGKNFHEHVYMTRNALLYPTQFFKQLFKSQKMINLHIFEHLHPSFRLVADMLEESVNKLTRLTLQLLEEYGPEISSKQMLVERLAEIAIQIYILTAILARASRSYCIGVRNAETEKYIAMLFGYRMKHKMEILENEIILGESQNGDAVKKLISDAVFFKKGYMCENPLTRTY